MDAKVSIGAFQPLAIKWTSFLFTAGVCGLVSVAFCLSAKPGYGFGVGFAVLLLAYTGLRTLYTANVYVSGARFVIEHAVRGTHMKDGALFSHVETAYFYYRVVFRDGTGYFFSPASPAFGKPLSRTVRAILTTSAAWCKRNGMTSFQRPSSKGNRRTKAAKSNFLLSISVRLPWDRGCCRTPFIRSKLHS